MKSKLALTIAFVLGTAGAALAGMQGQGGSPDAPASGDKEAMTTGGTYEELLSLDTNGDGQISEEEMAADKKMSRHWDQMDVDADGRLTEEEFSMWQEEDIRQQSADEQ